MRLRTANRLWCNSLHEGVVWPSNHRLFYLGMQDQWCDGIPVSISSMSDLRIT